MCRAVYLCGATVFSIRLVAEERDGGVLSPWSFASRFVCLTLAVPDGFWTLADQPIVGREATSTGLSFHRLASSLLFCLTEKYVQLT